MAITFVSSASIVNASTSGAINTTGANFIVAQVANFAGNSSMTFTDNKGNTWNAVADANGNNAYCGIRYAINPTVGTGHTFTINNGGGFAGISYIRAYSGVDTTAPFDVSAATANAGGTGTSGTVTPSQANSLVIVGCSVNGNYTSGPTAGFTDRGHNNANLLADMGGGIGDLIQTTITAVNPGYTWTSAVTISAAVFKPISATTTNQTYTGKARIQITTTQTYTGKGRIQQNVTQTYTGKARLTGLGSQTYTGKSRITANATQTYTGKARLQRTVLQTYTGKALIQLITTQTYTGRSRIAVGTNQTYTGKARVTATTIQTITGRGSIKRTVTQDITGLARIQIVTTRTYTGKALIFEQPTPIPLIRVFKVMIDTRAYRVARESGIYIVVPDTRSFII